MRRATLLTIVMGLLLALTAGAALALTYNRIECSSDPCTGTNRADLMIGTNKAELIRSGPAFDKILARGGNDSVHGQAGNDTMNGEDGNDTLKGSFGDDYIRGYNGSDTLYGHPGSDRLRGGPGNNDTIYAAGDTSNRDYVHCGTGTGDTAYLDTNDVVDGVVADTLVVNSGFSCERIFVNGILIPTGP